jgi:protocatechuate 3,4-dioxygenase beta subunit
VDPEQDGRATRDAFRADEVLGARVLRTDGDGQFRIERLEPGPTLIKVEHEGFADWYRRDLVVTGDGVQPILAVTLTGALSIRGRVLTEEGGTPIPGAWVYAEENGPGPAEPQDPGRVRALVATQTGPDGGYVLDRLPPGKCRVAVWLALGFQNQTRRDVVVGSTGVDFRLAATPPPAPPAR